MIAFGQAGSGLVQAAGHGLDLEDLPLTLTMEEAAKLLGIGRNQAYHAAARGQIPMLRIGRRMLVPTAPLRRMLGLESTPVATGEVA